MRYLQILIILYAGFVIEANAQLCGTYSTTFYVKNEAGQPVKNVRFKINPLKGENYAFGSNLDSDKNDPSQYSISFNEGHVVKGRYNVVVSAPGFSDAKREIEFPHCMRPKYEVVLKPAAAKSVIREMVEIRGELWKDKNRLGSVAISATDNAGKIFKTRADKEGLYDLNLPLGNYTLVYEKTGYKTLKIVNVIINEHRNIYIYNAELEFLGSDKKDDVVVKDFKDLYKSFNL